MNTARKGRRFEHEIVQLLKQAGFSAVRGAASKGELFGNKVDIVASRVTAENEYTAYLTIVGVQCKANKLKSAK